MEYRGYFVKFVLSLLVSLSVVFGTASASFASPCATSTEKEALDYRAMQSMLMVAALSCNQQTHYNKFITKHRQALSQNAAILKHYFQRVYGKRADDKLNAFITDLANEASRSSLGSSSESYCTDTEEVFGRVLDNSSSAVKVSTSKQFANLHNIRACR